MKKFQVFLKSKDKVCSITLRAYTKSEAEIQAIKEAKRRYGIDFRVWEVFEG